MQRQYWYFTVQVFVGAERISAYPFIYKSKKPLENLPVDDAETAVKKGVFYRKLKTKVKRKDKPYIIVTICCVLPSTEKAYNKREPQFRHPAN